MSHPNVLPFYGAYMTNEKMPRICLVSPWMENGNLIEYLDTFPETPPIPLVSVALLNLIP
jgi:serine/threonine protein kinase